MKSTKLVAAFLLFFACSWNSMAQSLSCDQILESLAQEQETPSTTFLSLLQFLFEEEQILTVEQYQYIAQSVANRSTLIKINLGTKSSSSYYSKLLLSYFKQWEKHPDYLDRDQLIEQMNKMLLKHGKEQLEKSATEKLSQEQFLLIEKFALALQNIRTQDQAVAIFKEVNDLEFQLILLDTLFEKSSEITQGYFFQLSFEPKKIVKRELLLQKILEKANEHQSVSLLNYLIKYVYPEASQSFLSTGVSRFLTIAENVNQVRPFQEMAFYFFRFPVSTPYQKELARLIDIARVKKDTNILIYLIWNCFALPIHANKTAEVKEVLKIAFEMESRRIIKEFEEHILSKDWTHQGPWEKFRQAINAPSFKRSLELLP